MTSALVIVSAMLIFALAGMDSLKERNEPERVVVLSTQPPADPAPVAAMASAPIRQPRSLRALDEPKQQRFADILSAGAAADAGWSEKLRAAEVLRRCRGFGHQRSISTMSFGEALEPGAYRMLEAGIRERVARCDDLLRLPASTVASMEASVLRTLTSDDSPLAPPVLRQADGSPLSADQLAAAKAQMRQRLDHYGPQALRWLRTSLRELHAIESVGDPRVGWSASMSAEAYAAAVEIAVCRMSSDCGAEDRCLSSGRCLADEHTDADVATQVAQLVRELSLAMMYRDWRRLGL